MNDKNKSVSFAQEISPWFPTSKLPDFRNDFVMANEALYNNNALTNTQSQSDGARSNAPENLMQPPPHIRDPVIQEAGLPRNAK